MRDLVRSRGLGDVYKRQRQDDAPAADNAADVGGLRYRVGRQWPVDVATLESVSYTHLTLPTSDLV